MKECHQAEKDGFFGQRIFLAHRWRGWSPCLSNRSPVLLVLCLVCALAGGPLSAEPGKRLQGVQYLGDLPTLVADEQGYFDKAGLDLVVDFGRSGLENLALLRAGGADFALMALTPLVLDRLNHAGPDHANDPLILASISHSIGLDHVMARADAGIDHPRDLAGRRVGVMRGTNAELLLSFFLTYHGMSPEDVDLVDMPTDQVSFALRDGELDAGVLWEPWASQLERDAEAPLLRFPVSNVYTARWVLVVRREALEAFPEGSIALLGAYQQAIEFMDRNPERAIDVYARHSGLSADVVRHKWDGLIYGLTLNWSLLTGLHEEAEWAKEAGYVPPDRELRPLSFIAVGPLQSRLPAAVALPRERVDEERSQ